MTRIRPVTAKTGAVLTLGLLSAAAILLRGSSSDDHPTAVARRIDLRVTLSETGVLRPAHSVTYRSGLIGREGEVTFLAPEGTYVNEGDLIARLDTAELERELGHAMQIERQTDLEERIASADREEAVAGVDATTNGEKALEVEEARTKLQFAETKVARLRVERDGLVPLLDKGYITRDELDRATSELEQASADVALLRRRASVLTDRTFPREQRHAELQLAQRDAQLQNTRERRLEAAALITSLKATIDACRIYAKRPGLVMYEELLGSSPRRKVRVGDRVTTTHGLATIPELDQMLMDTSVRESDVWRLRIGQRVEVSVDAFPSLRMPGRVTGLGTVGRSTMDRPFEEKRFDVTVALDEANRNLRPEMTARATIAIAERDRALVIPVGAVFDRGRQRVAYVVSSGRPEERLLTLGESNDFDIEVLQGLRDGERVALSDPAAPISSRPGEP